MGDMDRFETPRQVVIDELTRNKSADPRIISSPQVINSSKRLFVSALDTLSTGSPIEMS